MVTRSSYLTLVVVVVVGVVVGVADGVRFGFWIGMGRKLEQQSTRAQIPCIKSCTPCRPSADGSNCQLTSPKKRVNVQIVRTPRSPDSLTVNADRDGKLKGYENEKSYEKSTGYSRIDK